MLDGDWDLRGHLDPEAGTLLAREIERRDTPGAAAKDDPALNALATPDSHHDNRSTDTGGGSEPDSDGDSGSVGGKDIDLATTGEDTPADTADHGLGPNADPDTDSGHIPRTPDPHASTAPRTLPAGQRRHDAYASSCATSPTQATTPSPAAAGHHRSRSPSTPPSTRSKDASARSPAPSTPHADRPA